MHVSLSPGTIVVVEFVQLLQHTMIYVDENIVVTFSCATYVHSNYLVWPTARI